LKTTYICEKYNQKRNDFETNPQPST